MMDKIQTEYFGWLCNQIKSTSHDVNEYKELLLYLHSEEFYWITPMDENRAEDGIALRERFASDNNYDFVTAEIELVGPCSVLEMMVALSIRCYILFGPQSWNTTGTWFWNMIKNLGLQDQVNSSFSQPHCLYIIDRFLEHKYEPNGKGGLFPLNGADPSLKNHEIWDQMSYYLGTI